MRRAGGAPHAGKLSNGNHVTDRTQVIEEFFVPPGNEEDSAAAGHVAHGALKRVWHPRDLATTFSWARTASRWRSSKPSNLPRTLNSDASRPNNIATTSRRGMTANCPSAFYTNGHEIFFWNLGEAPPQRVHGFPTRQDLERLLYIRKHKKPLTDELINTSHCRP
jgi:type I restriction enzyme, R subunit